MLDNGYKTIASCDGVRAHHPGDEYLGDGYIAMMESPKVKDLIAMFWQEGFSIGIYSSDNAYELYGNMVEGIVYRIGFFNYEGENSKIVEKLVKDITESKIKPNPEILEKVNEIEVVIKENEENSEMLFAIYTGGMPYQPYMKKDGTSANLVITSRDDRGYYKNREDIINLIVKEFNVPFKNDRANDRYDDDIFVIENGKYNVWIYYNIEKYRTILDIVRMLRKIKKT